MTKLLLTFGAIMGRVEANLQRKEDGKIERNICLGKNRNLSIKRRLHEPYIDVVLSNGRQSTLVGTLCTDNFRWTAHSRVLFQLLKINNGAYSETIKSFVYGLL